MGENEGFPLSHMLTDFNSIHTSLLLENEYLKSMCNIYRSIRYKIWTFTHRYQVIYVRDLIMLFLSDKKEYRKKLCDEYVAVTKYITYLEDLQKEKISREKLINDSIER